jgi:hypothetical protein
MLPFQSLNSATAIGAGAELDLEALFSIHFMVVTIFGSSATCSVNLEGSLDGVNWLELAVAAVGSASPTSGAMSPNNYQSAAPIVRYVRANLISLSGSGASVTAWISSGHRPD